MQRVASHWHNPERAKACTICGERKGLGAFYSYPYTTKQGRRSIRYESRCKPCSRTRRKEQYHSAPDQGAAARRDWYCRNQDQQRAYRKARQADPEHRANKAKAQRLRKARMRSGQENDDAIKAIYIEAFRIEQLVAGCPVFDLPELGHKMHVDHIIPLARGGKHIASNLQILPAGLNMRKGVSCPL